MSGCREVTEQWTREIRRGTPAVVILLEGWPGERDKLIGETWSHACEQHYDSAYTADVAELIADIHASNGVAVLVAEPPPSVPDLSPKFARSAGAEGSELEALLDQRMECQNRVKRELAKQEDVLLLDLAAELCPDGRCRRRLWGLPIRQDGVHFRSFSASWAAGWIFDTLASELSRSLRSGEEDGAASPGPEL